jgi:hypothetical protein
MIPFTSVTVREVWLPWLLIFANNMWQDICTPCCRISHNSSMESINYAMAPCALCLPISTNVLWHVNPLLVNGLLKHVSNITTETSSPRQHTQKRFRYKGCSHSNERQIREVWTLGDLSFIRFDQNLPQGETDYKTETGHWRVLPRSRSPAREQYRREKIGNRFAQRFRTRSI